MRDMAWGVNFERKQRWRTGRWSRRSSGWSFGEGRGEEKGETAKKGTLPKSTRQLVNNLLIRVGKTIPPYLKERWIVPQGFFSKAFRATWFQPMETENCQLISWWKNRELFHKFYKSSQHKWFWRNGRGRRILRVRKIAFAILFLSLLSPIVGFVL